MNKAGRRESDHVFLPLPEVGHGDPYPDFSFGPQTPPLPISTLLRGIPSAGHVRDCLHTFAWIGPLH